MFNIIMAFGVMGRRSYGLSELWAVGTVPCRCSEGFLLRRFIVPKVRWSEGLWSEGSLVRRSLVRRFVGLKVR